MEFRRMFLDNCSAATGTVIVIDVLRAFSSACYAFRAGAPSIALAGTVEEAFALRRQIAGALIMGEVGGLPVEGFDFDNSPAAFDHVDLSGHPMIQRTSSGVQGAILSQAADLLLAASFCCADATARFVRKKSPETVTFVITGGGPEGRGDEDAACADFLETLLKGESSSPDPFIERVYASPAGRRFLDPGQPDFPVSDLEYCVRVSSFDFTLQIDRRGGLLVMEAVES
jgi:2-phosphosulfolactate phosphatase